MTVRLLCGDALEQLRLLPDKTIDAVVTDPPYGLNFMGKDWDHGIPGQAFWREVLRVAKPGAHLLAFGGTRTFHRLTCAIEDAGWEIRDCLMWVYGSGFPKSLDVSKAIDKAAGAERERGPHREYSTGRHYAEEPSQGKSDGFGGKLNVDRYVSIPASDAARQWQGWGTGLKPAWEPIILARKPLEGTVAENVQKWGTGALNIDGCRIAGAKGTGNWGGDQTCTAPSVFVAKYGRATEQHPAGRWPANLIHDGSDEVVGMFPQSNGQQAAVKGTEPSETGVNCYGRYARGGSAAEPRGDSGSAARFFYCAKASKEDRDEGLYGDMVSAAELTGRKEGSAGLKNARASQTCARRNVHPTVKPTDLMTYLCRLVTPPGTTVLDPFMGSGSTGKAAVLEGFEFIGIDNVPEYVEIARRRIQGTAPLFAEVNP